VRSYARGGLAGEARVAKVQKSKAAAVATPVVADRPSKAPTLSASDYATLTKQSPNLVFAALRVAAVGRHEQRTRGEWDAIMDAARSAAA